MRCQPARRLDRLHPRAGGKGHTEQPIRLRTVLWLRPLVIALAKDTCKIQFRVFGLGPLLKSNPKPTPARLSQPRVQPVPTNQQPRVQPVPTNQQPRDSLTSYNQTAASSTAQQPTNQQAPVQSAAGGFQIPVFLRPPSHRSKKIVWTPQNKKLWETSSKDRNVGFGGRRVCGLWGRNNLGELER